MGCGLSLKKQTKHSSLNFPAKTHDLTVTPGTFVRLTTLIKLNDYKQLKKIGSSSFTDVFLCTHLPTNTQRALKIIYKLSLNTQHKDSTLLLKEIQILKRLDHPNILKCFEVFEDNLKYYIATEYCPGGDLFKQIIEMRSFTEKKAAKILFQLFSAVSYCHSKSVIHRDIKPENIFLVENGEDVFIKLGDFGSSCMFDKDTKIKGCCGSSYYLAPEVLGESYDEKCDIWSIGIILFLLLTGTPPYQGRDNKEIVKEIQNCPFQLTAENVENLSFDSVDLITKLIKVNPELRISASDALQHNWIVNHRNYSSESLKTVLNNLKQFHSQSKLQEAVQVYIASQIASHQEIKEIQKQFQMLDKDGNGKITKDELLQEYSKTMSFTQASQVVENILGQLDSDGDGNIDYGEFLVSCGKGLKKVVQENLKAAFKAFDLDENGVITAEEIRSVLENGQVTDDETWKMILSAADRNGDGFIDFEEFVEFMEKVKF